MTSFGLGFTQFFDFISMPDTSSRKQSEALSFGGIELEDWEREGVVVNTINPGEAGRVKAFATYWSAFTQENLTLLPGARVVVTGRQGLVLMVKPKQQATKATRF